MARFQSILHPTDFSERSLHAFRLACSLARDHEAQLVVLHVAAPPPIAYGSGVPVFDQLEENRAVYLEKLAQLQPRDPGIRVEYRLERGEAAGQIVRVAKEIGCDLIVMGTHGRTGFGRLMMGSVAEEVLRKAPCPVLSLKAATPFGWLAAEPVSAGAV